MKTYEVLLTPGAQQDLASLHLDLMERVSPESAEFLLADLLEAAQSLTTLPDRGAIPAELAWLGIREYRQLLFRRYRLIYRPQSDEVLVHVIADQRQDFQTLLQARLLGA